MMSGQTPPNAPGAETPDPASATGEATANPQETAATPEPDATALAARVGELEGQIGDLTDRLLRAHAELDNIRKRAEREKADTAKYAVTKLAGEMVAVVDNLQRALAATPPEQQTGAAAALYDGVRLTEQSLLATLERHGVRRIAAQGAIFDPNLHEAVFQEDNAGVPSGTVLQVFQDGFTIEGRTLRAAMVKIARGGPKPGRPADAAPQPGQGPGGTETTGGR
ncbi:MAG: nucleotide exchange factor GrpE [Hyphomicrobiaceae bacterium]